MKPQWRQQCMKQQVTGPFFTSWCDLLHHQSISAMQGKVPVGQATKPFCPCPQEAPDNKVPSCTMQLRGVKIENHAKVRITLCFQSLLMIVCCTCRLSALMLPLLHLLDARLSVASSSVFQGQLLFQGCLFKKYLTGSSLSSVVLRV